MTDVDQLRAQARTAMADGRLEEALTAYERAAAAALALPPTDPARIALAGEHGDALFDHRDDPGGALEIATVVYEEAVGAIDDAGEHPAAVTELAALRDRMTYWAFRL